MRGIIDHWTFGDLRAQLLRGILPSESASAQTWREISRDLGQTLPQSQYDVEGETLESSAHGADALEGIPPARRAPDSTDNTPISLSRPFRGIHVMNYTRATSQERWMDDDTLEESEGEIALGSEEESAARRHAQQTTAPEDSESQVPSSSPSAESGGGLSEDPEDENYRKGHASSAATVSGRAAGVNAHAGRRASGGKSSATQQGRSRPEPTRTAGAESFDDLESADDSGQKEPYIPYKRVLHHADTSELRQVLLMTRNPRTIPGKLDERQHGVRVSGGPDVTQAPLCIVAGSTL